MDFLVGTFYTPKLFTLRFTAPSSLEIKRISKACGGHSWLSLSKDHRFLYTTVWADPPAVASYKINPDGSATFLNSKPIKAMSGYVVPSETHLYTAGGPTGEVFAIQPDGNLGELVQELNFRSEKGQDDGQQEEVAHGNFGGLRHGSHSVDFSPDGRSLYIGDIGHNCVWSYSVDAAAASAGKPPLTLGMKWIASRSNDGPRHTWPHPNGRYLYSLQEHSSMVDVLSVAEDGTTLELINGVKIIPADKDPKLYWADEVRLSRPVKGSPRYLYASTRGLDKECKGYVAAFNLDADGLIVGDAIDIYETATSGGIANAVEPAPDSEENPGIEYMALTDSQEGYVFVLGFDGKRFHEAARTQLFGDDGKPLASATAVWL
ncbi:muconate cycloisomerase I, MLE [Delphinella strobiligena]|nr:muconate cycloisomerase I, MLE [Delphinella strobiligena]